MSNEIVHHPHEERKQIMILIYKY